MKRERLKELESRSEADAEEYLCEALSELEAAHANLDMAGVPHKEESLHVRIAVADELSKSSQHQLKVVIGSLTKERDKLRNVLELADDLINVGHPYGGVAVEEYRKARAEL